MIQYDLFWFDALLGRVCFVYFSKSKSISYKEEKTYFNNGIANKRIVYNTISI